MIVVMVYVFFVPVVVTVEFVVFVGVDVFSLAGGFGAGVVG